MPYGAFWTENHAFIDTQLAVNQLFVSQLEFTIVRVKKFQITQIMEITENFAKSWDVVVLPLII